MSSQVDCYARVLADDPTPVGSAVHCSSLARHNRPYRNVVYWAIYPDVPKSRQALEADLGFIRPEGEQVLDALLQLAVARRSLIDDRVPDVQRRQPIYRAALAHGATTQAVLDAYIAEYGALECFALPYWFHSMKPRFADTSPSRAGDAYSEAIDRIMAESGGKASRVWALTGVGREVFAALLWGQGINLVRSVESVQGLDARLIAMRGFAALQSASMVYTEELFPLTFAKFIPDWTAAQRAVTGQ